MIRRLLALVRVRRPRLVVPSTFPSTPESRAIVAEVEQRTAAQLRRAAAAAPCEPTRAPESTWVRGSGAPPKVPLVPIVVLPDEEYERWLAEHPDDAA